MNKSAPLRPSFAILTGLGVSLLAFHVSGLAQPPGPTPKASGVAPAILPVANPDPAAPKVETPADENKSDEATVPPDDTEILATDGATFTAKDRIAIFNRDVRVRDPRFTLACDKLTAYLARGSVPGPSSTPPPVETPAKTGDDKSDEASRGGGIDRAIAEGHVIIIQKHAPTRPGEEEKLSIGRADIVEFDNKTGDITLRGLPKVEQNGNVHEALSRSTWMVLHRDNSLDTHGPNRTLIVPRSKDNLPGTSPVPRAGATPPSASPANKRAPTTGTPS